MELFKIRKDIPFMRHALVLNAVSFVTFALAVFFLFSRQFLLFSITRHSKQQTKRNEQIFHGSSLISRSQSRQSL